ncbi:TrkA family potassium uptake protein [Vulcanisaeta sp. JCM 16159]|uniref:potassium channel family protein n=1 Tax=Vulcanisaeta sp. JCM 16159 TaxID=1295371 RepID=UPI0006D0E840|nr:NAD-binding protein [Vulcanisaeta sp. JCM 16159]
MRKALIIGINEISVVVARLLVGNGYDVGMIAGNENEAKLGRGVPAYVYVGDPRDESILRNAGIDESEVVVLSMDDESNLEVARIAKSRGVPTIIALVSNKEKYLDSFIELGVYAIPIVDAILSKIAHYLRLPFKQLLYSDDKVQAYYVVISSESPYINQEVRGIARKCGVAIPLIIRGEDVIVSDEEVRIEAGDKLLIVGASDSVVKCIEKIY